MNYHLGELLLTGIVEVFFNMISLQKPNVSYKYEYPQLIGEETKTQ